VGVKSRLFVFSRVGGRDRRADAYVVKDGGAFWSVGEESGRYAEWLRTYGVRGPADVFRTMNGARVVHMASAVYDFDEGGGWACVKNRNFGRPADPPFSCIEEARLKSAAAGWPDPVRICGASWNI
jgi:hypothetical protein